MRENYTQSIDLALCYELDLPFSRQCECVCDVTVRRNARNGDRIRPSCRRKASHLFHAMIRISIDRTNRFFLLQRRTSFSVNTCMSPHMSFQMRRFEIVFATSFEIAFIYTTTFINLLFLPIFEGKNKRIH